MMNKFKFLILLSAIWWQSKSPCQQNQSTIEYPDVSSKVSFTEVTILPFNKPDQKIEYGTNQFQYGWLWKTKNGTNKPLIILVHGGCWLNAFSVDHTYPMASALALAGFPVWSLEYRRTGDEGGGWPGSFEDIKLALNQVKLLNKFGVTTDQLILMGHSAGGHLALLAATELPDNNFQKVIGLAAITDVSRYALGNNSCQQATQQFFSGLPHEQQLSYQQANLIYRKTPKNFLLLQGDADQIVPPLQSRLFQVQSELVPGAGHFDWIHPGSPAFGKLIQIISP